MPVVDLLAAGAHALPSLRTPTMPSERRHTCADDRVEGVQQPNFATVARREGDVTVLALMTR